MLLAIKGNSSLYRYLWKVLKAVLYYLTNYYLKLINTWIICQNVHVFYVIYVYRKELKILRRCSMCLLFKQCRNLIFEYLSNEFHGLLQPPWDWIMPQTAGDPTLVSSSWSAWPVRVLQWRTTWCRSHPSGSGPSTGSRKRYASCIYWVNPRPVQKIRVKFSE